MQLVKQTIDGWRFEPVVEDGRPVTANAGMAIRVVADMIDETHATFRITGAACGCDAYQVRDLLPGVCPPGTTVRYADHSRRAPEFPGQALTAGAGADV